MPIPIVGAGRQLRNLLGRISLEVKSGLVGRIPGVGTPKSIEGDGAFDCRGLIHTQINDLTIIRHLFQMIPRTFGLSLCRLQRDSYLFLFILSIGFPPSTKYTVFPRLYEYVYWLSLYSWSHNRWGFHLVKMWYVVYNMPFKIASLLPSIVVEGTQELNSV